MPQTEIRRIHIQRVTEWLIFLYPISLAVNKTAHDVVTAIIFLGACGCLAFHARDLKSDLACVRWPWIAALCLPLLLTAIQYASLVPVLKLRDFDDNSRFFLSIPVYLAFTIVKPKIRPFLWGCVFFAAYSVGLMFWHMRVLGLDRGIGPNGFLGIIPHTSLAIVLAMVAMRLSLATDETFKKRVLPAILMGCAFSVPLLTQTRSGLLLASVLAVFVWLLLPGKKIKILLFGGAVAIGVMGIVLSNSSLWSRNDRTLAEIEQYAAAERPAMTSATIRIELWRYAGQMLVEHPLIGVGIHRFNRALSDYKIPGKTPAELAQFTHPHNEFLRFGAEGGLLGMLSLALLYFVPLVAGVRSYLRQPSATNPALMVILFSSGFLIGGMVDVVLAWRPTIMFYGVVMSLLLVQMDRADRLEPK